MELIYLAPGEPCPEADTGDFMLIRGGTAVSKMLRLFLSYSHVVSFTTWPLAADAQARGVEELNVSRYEGVRRVLVKLGASEEDREQMAQFLRSVLDAKWRYNYIGLVVSGLMILTGGKLSIRFYSTSYCSGLGAETATRAGYIWPKPPSSMTPDDLALYFGAL